MPLVVSAWGLVSSVGRSGPAACAAIRSGICRPAPLAYFKTLDDETQGLEPLTGHPLRGYTDGFVGAARWLRMARGALQDLLAHPGLAQRQDAGFWHRAGMLLVAPIAPSGPATTWDTHLKAAFLRPLLQRAGLPVPEAAAECVAQGPAGTATAVRRANEWLQRRAVDRVLLLAVDSLLDLERLRSLDDVRRLKTRDVPTGLAPGEAAVCLLLESASSAARAQGSGALILSASAGREERPFLVTGDAPQGQGLALCIQSALSSVAPSGPFTGGLYADLNGETWRAQQWGAAAVRLADRVKDPELHLPCMSVGDVGAASGALGVCLALHDLTNGHSRTGQALVVSSSDSGEVGCIALGRAAV